MTDYRQDRFWAVPLRLFTFWANSEAMTIVGSDPNPFPRLRLFRWLPR